MYWGLQRQLYRFKRDLQFCNDIFDVKKGGVRDGNAGSTLLIRSKRF